MWRRLVDSLLTSYEPRAAGVHAVAGRRLIDLPDAVLDSLASAHLRLRDALAVCSTCKVVHNALGVSCRKRLDVQLKTVVGQFPLHIIDSLPMVVWLDVECIEFCNKWVGMTGYVDNVKPDDIRGSPYKCTRDMHGRLMLLMRRRSDVAVLFQRYFDSDWTWVFASNTLPIGGCRLTESMAARLALWLAHDYADFSRE